MKKIFVLTVVILAMAFALSLAVGAAPAKADLPFSDVKSGDWFYGSVKQMYDSNLMKGVSKSEFAPGDTLTRGMCVTILYRAAGEPDTDGRATFVDVNSDAYYAKAVSWAQKNGVVNTYEMIYN